jgi:flagellar protein FliO/FliZ
VNLRFIHPCWVYSLAALPLPLPAAAEQLPGASLLSWLVPLGLIALCAVLAAWLVSRGRGSLTQRDGPIRLVHIRPVGPRERLVLVEVQNRRLLIGVTATQISALAQLDCGAQLQATEAAAPRPGPVAPAEEAVRRPPTL